MSFFVSSMDALSSSPFAFKSLICLLRSSTSSCWYSISFVSPSYSRLFRTFISWPSYFLMRTSALFISWRFVVMSAVPSFSASCNFSIRICSPAIPSSKSSTAIGSSPRSMRICAMRESTRCNSYKTLKLFSSVNSSS